MADNLKKRITEAIASKSYIKIMRKDPAKPDVFAPFTTATITGSRNVWAPKGAHRNQIYLPGFRMMGMPDDIRAALHLLGISPALSEEIIGGALTESNHSTNDRLTVIFYPGDSRKDFMARELYQKEMNEYTAQRKSSKKQAPEEITALQLNEAIDKYIAAAEALPAAEKKVNCDAIIARIPFESIIRPKLAAIIGQGRYWNVTNLTLNPIAGARVLASPNKSLGVRLSNDPESPLYYVYVVKESKSSPLPEGALNFFIVYFGDEATARASFEAMTARKKAPPQEEKKEPPRHSSPASPAAKVPEPEPDSKAPLPTNPYKTKGRR